MPESTIIENFLFKLALRRATRSSYRSGTITGNQANVLFDAVFHPQRKDLQANQINLMDALRLQCIVMVRADAAMSADIKQMVRAPSFNWGNIWEWITNNLPAILKALMTLISIFVLFV
jgi:hypothetical protein